MLILRKRRNFLHTRAVDAEHRLRIAHAERLDRLKAIYICERQFRRGHLTVDGDARLGFFGGIVLRSIGIDARAERLKLFALDRQTHGQLVSAVFQQQRRRILQRAEQVKTFHAPAGTFSHVAFQRNQDCRNAVAVRDA